MALTAKQLKDSKQFRDNVAALYGGGLDYQAERYTMLYNKHTADFGKGGAFFSSPGRIEVIGNHTDHNNGKVLCASISVDNLGCVTPLDGKIVVASIGYPVVEVDIDDLLPNADEYGKSEALVRGVIAYYKEHRSLFQNGRFVLLSLPGASTMDWEVIAEDGSEATIASFRFIHDPIPAPSFLRGAFFESGALYEVLSRPFELDLGTFGGLVNQVAPFHLNPEGPLFDLISRYKTQPADEERLLVSGSMLNTGRVPLHEEWNGTGLNPEVKVRGEGGSRLYYIRKK